MADVAVLGLKVDATGAIVATDALASRLNRLSGTADTTTGRLAKLAGGFLTFATGALAVRKFVDESIAAQNAQAQLEAAIRSTGGAAGRTVEQLQSVASALQDFSTFSDEAVQGAQALLLTFKSIKGDVFDDATRAVVDLASRLGGDLNGAALQVGKALQDPAQGLTALRRSGVSFTDSQVELIKRLQQTGELAKAQQIILAELRGEFGGSAAAARNTLGGALTFVGNKFGELFEITRTGSGGLIGLLNSIGIALGVIKNNADAFVPIAKGIAAAAVAYVAYSSAAKAAAIYTALLAATQTITAFLSLAKGIRSAADAMALLSLVGKGAAGAVAAVAALAVGFVAYKKLASEVAAETAKFNAELNALAGAGGGGTGDLTGGIASAAKADAEERVRLAQQALALAKLDERSAALQVVNNKAINDGIKARAELRGRDLAVTLRAIEEERKLGTDTVLVERAKVLNAENQKRLLVSGQVVGTLQLEGEALARQQVENDAINKLFDARLTLSGSELEARERVIAREREVGIAAVETNAIVARRKVIQDDINARAKDALQEQQRIRENFERQFQQTFSDGIANILTDGLSSFKSFFASIRDLFIKAIADVVASSAFKKVAGGLSAIIPGVSNNNPFKIAGTAEKLGAGAAAVGATLGIGYAVGSQTTSKTAGALGGAAAGAATGAAIGAFAGGPLAPLTATVGAAIGAFVGAIGGFLGASKNATQEVIRQAAAQKQLQQSLESLRASFNNDALGAAIAQVRIQYEELRKSTEAAFSGKKNESERNRVLAELNELEARRIALLKEEFAEGQRRQQQDLDVRRLIAEGQDEAAAAAAFRNTQEREYADAVKAGADAATLAAITATQFAEATKRAADAEKERIRTAENSRRAIVDYGADALAFTDPRAAEDVRAIEDASRRVFDAIANGASEAELAAIAFFNTAKEAARQAQRAENDLRTSESLQSRGLAAVGRAREGDDAAFVARQRQELADADANGISASNRAFLEFVQFAEASQRRMEQAITDGTNAINKRADNQIAANQLLIDVIRDTSARQIERLDQQISETQKASAAQSKAFDQQIAGVRAAAQAQSEAIDAQIVSARGALDVAKGQLATLEQAVSVGQKVVQAVDDFLNSSRLGDLSTLSPLDKKAEADRQFSELLLRAQGGDADAASALPGAASAFLEAARAFDGSTPAYVQVFDRVQAALTGIRNQFGASLPTDVQALEAARRTVTGIEQTIDALGAQKDAINAAAERQIAVLQAAKDQAAERAQRIIDGLTAQRDAISADADAQIKKLETVNDAIRKAAEDEIAVLIANEEAAHQQRVKDNAYYATFLERLGIGAVQDRSAPFGDAPASEPLRVIVTPQGDSVASESLVELRNLRADNVALRESMESLATRLESALKRLENVEVAANGEQVGALNRIAQNTGTLVTDARQRSNAVRPLAPVR